MNALSLCSADRNKHYANGIDIAGLYNGNGFKNKKAGA